MAIQIFSIFLISTMTIILVQVQGKVISSPALESVQEQVGGDTEVEAIEENKIESGQSVINADAAEDETNDKDMAKVR